MRGTTDLPIRQGRVKVAVVASSDLDPLDNRGEFFTRYASGRLVFPVTRLRVGGVGLSGFL